MILNTGNRTDIPAYFSEWFYNRIKEGYVLVRNPYNPIQVTKYKLTPDVVDVIAFCTKNPEPMLSRIEELSEFSQIWFVTITPYGKDIEPYVPPADKVMESFQKLSGYVGSHGISWRYDPIIVTDKYSVGFHIEKFREMAEILKGYTKQCVVSFVDLYQKTVRNFPGVCPVSVSDQETLTAAFSQIAKDNGMQIHLCCENENLVRENVDADGCMSQRVIEKAIGCSLVVPKKKSSREGCDCLLGADIGVYNTCKHGCLYCYANYDRKSVIMNGKLHDPKSPFLIGHGREEDVIKEAEQKSWRDGQLKLFDFM